MFRCCYCLLRNFSFLFSSSLRRSDGLSLKVTNSQSHSKHKHKTPGVCFCPISSEAVSLEQMLRGSAVSVSLLPPHVSSSSLSTNQQPSEGRTVQGRSSFSHAHIHTHTLHTPFTVPLINYQTVTRTAFCF